MDEVRRVRGKFVVTRVTEARHMPAGARIVELGAIYKDPKSEENTLYHASTPTGKVELQIDNPVAAEFFKLNRFVYVDFTPAPEL